MRITCKNNSLPATMPLYFSRTIDFSPKDEDYVYSCDYYTISSAKNGYNVTIGKEYKVYGIMFVDNKVRYFVIMDGYSSPRWLPSELFDVSDPQIPFDWKVGSYISNFGEGMYLGYSELTDYPFMLDLLDGNLDAGKRFCQIRENIDSYEDKGIYVSL